MNLHSVAEFVGTFVASGETLHRATSGIPAVTDDRPLLEYDDLTTGVRGVPGELIDLDSIEQYCPSCFVHPETEASRAINAYLEVMRAYYDSDTFGTRRSRGGAPPLVTFRTRLQPDTFDRVVRSSGYLTEIITAP